MSIIVKIYKENRKIIIINETKLLNKSIFFSHCESFNTTHTYTHTYIILLLYILEKIVFKKFYY